MVSEYSVSQSVAAACGSVGVELRRYWQAGLDAAEIYCPFQCAHAPTQGLPPSSALANTHRADFASSDAIPVSPEGDA
eukprot:8408704-Pyramimonas_sp.AAC.2